MWTGVDPTRGRRSRAKCTTVAGIVELIWDESGMTNMVGVDLDQLCGVDPARVYCGVILVWELARSHLSYR